MCGHATPTVQFLLYFNVSLQKCKTWMKHKFFQIQAKKWALPLLVWPKSAPFSIFWFWVQAQHGDLYHRTKQLMRASLSKKLELWVTGHQPFNMKELLSHGIYCSLRIDYKATTKLLLWKFYLIAQTHTQLVSSVALNSMTFFYRPSNWRNYFIAISMPFINKLQ